VGIALIAVDADGTRRQLIVGEAARDVAPLACVRVEGRIPNNRHRLSIAPKAGGQSVVERLSYIDFVLIY
jgi:hypothetical protein